MKGRFGLGIVIASALLLVPASAVSAAPAPLELSSTFEDADFCGTGQTINVRSKAVIHLADRRPHFQSAKGRQVSMLVNPANGAQVLFRSGGQLLVKRAKTTTGYAVLMSFRGLPARMRIGTDSDYRAFRLRDPGYLLIVNHFTNDGEYVGSRLVNNERAMAASDNRAVQRFCRIAKLGLGL